MNNVINKKSKWFETICYYYEKAYQKRTWRVGLWIGGFLFQILVFLSYYFSRKHTQNQKAAQEIEKTYRESGRALALQEKLLEQEQNKNHFLHQNLSPEKIEERAEALYKKESQKEVQALIQKHSQEQKEAGNDFLRTTFQWLRNPIGFLLSILLAWPMYLFLLIVSVPTLSYIVNRLVMMLFVIAGVTFIVFTLLYLSPSDPAKNILGNQATPQQVENFRNLHGLNDSYWVQLGHTVKGIFTLDLGNAYAGNERVVTTILRRFPITLKLTMYALSLSLAIALPAGIYAAVKANTTFDQLFMLIALIGISIPSFWQGLIFILAFSINLGWLPATYQSANSLSLLMPAVVMGTGLMASVARMTRSSTLEVVHEDYILTARAKGLSSRRVILRHAVPNALIPVVTIIGLQFGGMLGGSAVTEKVFNINGIGSYIVDKQFVPDIPSVMGGVIYIAVVLSIVNMVVDLLYSFLDPRIRSRVQSGK